MGPGSRTDYASSWLAAYRKRHHSVELQLRCLGELLLLSQRAPAVGIVEVSLHPYNSVAAAQHFEVWEVNYGITARVPVGEVINLGLCAAQFDHCFLCVGGARCVGFAGWAGIRCKPRLFTFIGSDVGSGGSEPPCVAAVVLVNVRGGAGGLLTLAAEVKITERFYKVQERCWFKRRASGGRSRICPGTSTSTSTVISGNSRAITSNRKSH